VWRGLLVLLTFGAIGSFADSGGRLAYIQGRQLWVKDLPSGALSSGFWKVATRKEALTDYRDTIRFIFDKTIEGMNRGLTPDELVEYVQLPNRLAEKKYLQPYFGHPQWAVRSIFAGYLGWFDGNPTNLFPLSPRAEAERVVRLAGGQDRLVGAAQQALTLGDYQWAAQLSDYLLAVNKNSPEAKKIKVQALEALGERTVSAPARNYYFTVAQELRDGGR
jgi:alkyl sulfatase BDS1-like metallo-beta-lactamase superfamily hydrolase